MSRARVAVLISGAGSNMKALIEASRDPAFPAEIVCVVSNRPEAAGLALAESLGVEALAIDHRPFARDREAHERAIDAALRARGIEWVALAGYMRLLTPFLVEAWAGRMLNIHPSLLPEYPGLDTHQRVLDAGCDWHGCTVHQVIHEMDAGPIVGQARVPVLAGDDAAALAVRVQAAEHRLYPLCLAAAVEGRTEPIRLEAA